MWGFLIGVLIGAGAFWLYQQISGAGAGGGAPSWAAPGEAGGDALVQPTPSEIHGRPAEPFPGSTPATPAEGPAEGGPSGC